LFKSANIWQEKLIVCSIRWISLSILVFFTQDRSEYCSRWADGNKCIDRKDYMNLKCPKSCGLCGQSKLITASKTEAKCKDQSE